MSFYRDESFDVYGSRDVDTGEILVYLGKVPAKDSHFRNIPVGDAINMFILPNGSVGILTEEWNPYKLVSAGYVEVIRCVEVIE